MQARIWGEVENTMRYGLISRHSGIIRIPMVKLAILHIGFPKTGSSSLQVYLSENRVRLQEEYGICYPKAFTNFKKAHYRLNKLFAPTLRKENLNIKFVAEEVLNEAKGAEIIILSCENWADFQFDVSRLRAFLQYLDAKDAHIIGYVREHLDYIQSLWRERIHFRPQFTAPFFIFSEASHPVHNMQYPAMIRNMETVADVDLVWYDKNSFRDGNVISDFCARIGIREDNLPKQDSNPSIGGNLLLYKMVQNKISLENNLEGDKYERNKIMRYNELKCLARENESFRSAFFISIFAANQFRQKSEYNKFFINKLGPVKQKNFNTLPRFPDWANLGNDFEVIFDALNVRSDSFPFDAVRETIPFATSILEPRYFVRARTRFQKHRANKLLARALDEMKA